MIRIQNYSASPFRGWVRTTVPAQPRASLEGDGVRVVIGDPIGHVERGVSRADVYVSLGPSEGREIDLALLTNNFMPPVPPPTQRQLGRILPVQFAAIDMEFVAQSLRRVGAAWEARFERRSGMLYAILWARWYPDMPGLIFAEHAVHCSNPSLPIMASESVPDFQIGQYIALEARPPKPPRLADGQVWAASRVFAMPDMLGQGTYHQLADGLVTAVGIDRIMPDGDLPTCHMNAREWTNRYLPALRRDPWGMYQSIGVAPNSAQTGEQEAQILHVGTEALRPDGVGAQEVRYLSALRFGARPCHHLRADGSPVTAETNPGVVIWDGRPHSGLSTDKLGKQRELTRSDTSGWWGPDWQHWIVGDLFAAARLTGSPLVQHLLEFQARNYLMGRPADPRHAAGAIFSAREVGYECLFAVLCHENLEDGSLAGTVRRRLGDRMRDVILPQVDRNGGDHVFAFTDDARLGPGRWVIAWQECLAAYGLDLAARSLGAGGSLAAICIARRMLRDAWTQREDGRWYSRAQFPLDPTPTFTDDTDDGSRWKVRWREDIGAFGIVEGDIDSVDEDDYRARQFGEPRQEAEAMLHADFHWPAAPSTDAPMPPADASFNAYAMPLCAAVVLRRDPTDARALAVWRQCMAETGEKARRWMPRVEGVS